MDTDALSGPVDPSEVLRQVRGGVEVDIMVTPNAKADQVGQVDPWRKRLIIKVRAVPSEGRANEAVESLLTDFFGTKAQIVRGHTDRHKTVLVNTGVDVAKARLEGR